MESAEGFKSYGPERPIEGALVLWCFVLNPHRRPPYSKVLFFITRHATDEFPGYRRARLGATHITAARFCRSSHPYVPLPSEKGTP